MTGVMRANQEVLQALAQEGIQLFEEELLLMTQSQPHGLGSVNGAVASLPTVPWYAAVLCRVGIHKGPWTYLAEGQCTQTRECSRCEANKVRTKHQREWRYVGAHTCEQTRICTSCSTVSSDRTRHEAWSVSWSVRRYTDAHRCLRCGFVETWDTSPD